VVDYIGTGEKQLWKTKSLWKATDAEAPDGSFCGVGGLKHFIDYIVRFQVMHDTFNGSLRNKVATRYDVGRDSPELQPAPAHPQTQYIPQQQPTYTPAPQVQYTQHYVDPTQQVQSAPQYTQEPFAQEQSQPNWGPPPPPQG
jgi:hypothetical protein